jgi:tRNA uridine 5-carbamoylmethylation protein Kti12
MEFGLLKDIRFLPSAISTFAIICDPLHFLKRFRYRLATLLQVICPEEHFEFFFSVIQKAHILSPVVFNNSRESEVHASLPLELFSFKTLAYILKDPIVGETMMVP